MDKRKERIKEIERIRSELAKERDELYRQIREEEDAENLIYRKSFVGKCFELKEHDSRSYKYMKAFRILSLDENSRDGSSAICLCLYNRLNEKAIRKMRVSLFCSDIPRMMASPGDKLTIDMFQEITNDEFDQIKNEYLNIIVSA